MHDGSTDSGNIDNEIVSVVWFHQNGPDETVYTRTSYFNVYKPNSTSGKKILEGLSSVLKKRALLSLQHVTNLLG